MPDIKKQITTAGTPATSDGVTKLQSASSTRRLEQIADLRARGIGDHISLPQLVVCGDQSAGKSSVLEGITGIPFPRQDGVCTKFATEIILQHSAAEKTIVASLLPAADRSDSTKAKMKAYHKKLASFDELPSAIVGAGELMGIRGFGAITEGLAFTEDVLRIEVSGPLGLHLTVVDLPGIIANPNEEQTEEDVRKVRSLVESYVKNPRTIVLAVVQATNDIANQGIIQLSRRHDTAGERTVGIITKPDLINQGTEPRIALLSKNQDTTKLKLGYFIVKNPSPQEMASGVTQEERHKNEIRYFQSSPWKEQSLLAERVGILKLRSYLQTLLDKHIEQELPQVRIEIRKLLDETDKETLALGEERSSVALCRLFLSRLATRFNHLATSALNGTYHEADVVFFRKSDDTTNARFRALAHKLNTAFSDEMRDHGEKRYTVSKLHAVRFDSDEHHLDENDPNPQLPVTQSEMQDWIKEVYVQTRGKELPGNFNPVLLSELFSNQSSRWHQIAEDHIMTTSEEIDKFVQHTLNYVIKDENVLADIVDLTGNALRTQKKLADEELEELSRDERQQPITYNHYYTDNVQKFRQKWLEDEVDKAYRQMRVDNDGEPACFEDHGGRTRRLVGALKQQIIVDMDDQACSEAWEGLNAYYKVAMKTFVDNVCRQVIERHLLRNLPEIFAPETVAAMSDEELERIAGDTPANTMKRKELKERHEQLTEGLKNLRR